MKNSILALFLALIAIPTLAADKKVVFLAGGASHGTGEHEHLAGCLLLQSCLKNVPGLTSVVCTNAWPRDPAATFTNASTIVLYSDGGDGHPFLQNNRLALIDALMNRGVGLVCLHYAVEPTERGLPSFQRWIGASYKLNWSVNPVWTPTFNHLPDHPIARGVKPFSIHDEWYFHMRFRDDLKGIVPILAAVATPDTLSRPDGPHEGNPAVRESVKNQELQTVAWAYQRPNGGRGFGFTGGHFHKNWGDDNFRKVVLNAIVWTANANVPPNGVPSHVTAAQLQIPAATPPAPSTKPR